MGTEIKPNWNKTTFVRCPKDEQHPYNIVPANLYQLNGYQFAIMAQVLSNKDGWNIVKKEIGKRVGFPREKFNDAWKSLKDLGYIKADRIQRGFKYTVYEDIGSKSTSGGICCDFTSTTGRRCAGGMLTNTNNNYYREVTTTADGTCQDSQVNELIEIYPDNGTRPDGTSYKLKSKLDECRKAYHDYLQTNGMTHDEIKTALQAELADKQRSGHTQCQPGLLKWINERRFEQYRGWSIEPVEPGYGETLI